MYGDIIFANTLLDTTKSYETWRGGLSYSSKERLVDIGYTVDTIFRGMLIFYDVISGDTAASKKLAEYAMNADILVHGVYSGENANSLGQFWKEYLAKCRVPV